MTAIQKSKPVLLCLWLAVACLLGVFAIMDASTATANAGKINPGFSNLQPGIIISPTELQAVLSPGEQLTQTLWITNTGDSPLSISIYEMSGTVRDDGSSFAPVANPLIDLQVQAQAESGGSRRAIISLREQPDLSGAYQITDGVLRVQYVYDRLVQVASHSQELFQWLELQGAEPQRLWIANAIAATLDAEQLEALAGSPLVGQVSPNRQYPIITNDPSQVMGPELPDITSVKPNSVEWNIAKIRADEAWDTFGVRGQGAVVGIIDTGVMYDHPALVNSYRGNLGGGSFDHNYNWYDFVDGLPEPYDGNGHGTMGAGIVSGDDGEGNQIGVAPGARWIAVRACDDGGGCTYEDLLASLDWMLAPHKLDGSDPDPSKAPDVVLGMWGSFNHCDPAFQASLQALIAANILPVFAAGGGGPGCMTVSNPADLAETLTAGATDQDDMIAPFSGRGPGCNSIIKPDVSAPGVDIRTSYLGGGYITTSGTSWSAAHSAGAAAMLFSADPLLSLDQLRGILYTTAVCIDDGQCGGGTCPDPNNVYGHGRIDVFEAVASIIGQVDNIPWLDESPTAGTLEPGESTTISVTFDAAGLEPGTYTGRLDVASDDPLNPHVLVPVTLTVSAPCEPVEITYAGFAPPNPLVDEVIIFTATASGTLPLSYLWDFGDGSTAEGDVATHSFSLPGLHTVSLDVENTCSADQASLEVNVEVILKRILLPIIRR